MLLNKAQVEEAHQAFALAYEEFQKQEPNGSMLEFFIYTYERLLYEKKAMFLERIHLETFEYNKKETDEGNQCIFTFDVCSETNIILPMLTISFTVEDMSKIKGEMLADTVKNIVEIGLNGYLTSPIEKEKIVTMFAELTKSKVKEFSYTCDECGEHFNHAENLLNHLKKEKHRDSIWRQYGWFEPKFY
jgi:hypothetical protein